MAFLLGCENVSLDYPAKKIFRDLSLGIAEGDRIGIVGLNGDGKTSLLSLLARSIEPDSGRIMSRNGLRVGLLEQHDTLNSQASVAHEVVGDTPEHIWASDARIRSIIEGCIGDIPWDAIVGELSGGQRRRVDLAKVLVGDHDVLLLDEPTNHLDMRAIAWLATHLKQRWNKKTGAFLVITHDRWFLDEVCETMWEVHDGIVEPFEGGYSAYVLQRVERARLAQLALRKHNNLMRKELAWLSRGAQARATKPKFHVATARALIEQEPPVRNSLELKRSAMSRLGKQVVDLKNVTIGYQGNTVIDDVSWIIGPGDRYGILGENGAGKTTLLELIRGKLKPSRGLVKIGQTVKFAYLSQELTELHNLGDERVRDILANYKTRYEIEGKELTPAQLLERLGFENAHLSSRVNDLSGGQKRRLQLMLILLDRPNVLILDEPGNDLDTTMLAAMENLLDTWPGTLLLVSHDRYLMERVTDDQFALISGKIRHVPGGVDEYLRLLDEQDALQASTSQTTNKTQRVVSSAAEDRLLKKQLSSIERKIASLEHKIDLMRVKMTEVDPTDYMTLGAQELEIQENQMLIRTLEDEWIETSEKLS